MNVISKFFKPKKRYALMWSSHFKAYQVYRLDKNSTPIKRGFIYYDPSYFVGWAITCDTDKNKLHTYESGFDNPRFKIK